MNLQKLKNIFLLSILSIFALQMAGVAVFLVVRPVEVGAADATTFVPQVSIPGTSEFGADLQSCLDYCASSSKTSSEKSSCVEVCGIKFTESNRGTMLANYIKAWYKFAVAAVGILAVVVIMGGGLIWLTAGGSTSKIETAKEWLWGAVIGLIIALFSYTLLDILNPNLVTFKALDIKSVGGMANLCCSETDGPFYVTDKGIDGNSCTQRDSDGKDIAGGMKGTKCKNEMTCRQVEKNSNNWSCAIPCKTAKTYSGEAVCRQKNGEVINSSECAATGQAMVDATCCCTEYYSTEKGSCLYTFSVGGGYKNCETDKTEASCKVLAQDTDNWAYFCTNNKCTLEEGVLRDSYSKADSSCSLIEGFYTGD